MKIPKHTEKVINDWIYIWDGNNKNTHLTKFINILIELKENPIRAILYSKHQNPNIRLVCKEIMTNTDNQIYLKKRGIVEYSQSYPLIPTNTLLYPCSPLKTPNKGIYKLIRDIYWITLGT